MITEETSTSPYAQTDEDGNVINKQLRVIDQRDGSPDGEDIVREADYLEFSDGTYSYAEALAGESITRVIEGTSGDDALDGTAADDILYGYDGDDRFYSSSGNDTFDGGEGIDRVYYDRTSIDFTGHTEGVNINLTTGQVTDSSGKTDTLISIEGAIGLSLIHI